MMVKTPVDSTTNSASASPHLMLERSHSWKMVTAFGNDKLSFLSLDSAVELAMGRVILELVDYAVEINGSLIHLPELKEALVPNKAKCVHSDLHHHVLWMGLALHEKMWVFLEQEGAETNK